MNGPSFLRAAVSAATLTIAASLIGCGSTAAPLSTNQRDVLHEQTVSARNMFITDTPQTKRYFDTAYAYVIFPAVTSGAVGVGGAHGNGDVYQGGKLVGTADLTQMTIGAELGGQEFAEVIFFKDAGTYAEFTNGTWSFDAKASAVAASSGASTTPDYEKGVRVYTLAKGGLMAQAAIGTQKLRYRSLADEINSPTEGSASENP